jgi:glycosyltransferase involved in cell wall biosynthesis
MKKEPLISVVMPVYNTEKFVAEAIESILCQTFGDFEFIIVDDGSTDQTPEIIRSFTDERIVFEKLKSNQGVIKAFEHGIHKARGKWIARMDADDVSFPDRLSVELDFLNRHPECVLVGSLFHFISPAGKILKREGNPQSGWKYLTKEMLTFDKRKFADPSVMFLRKAALDVGLLDEDINVELPLWYKFMRVGKVAELYKPLHLYRIVLNSITHKRREESLRNIHKKIRTRYDPENAVPCHWRPADCLGNIQRNPTRIWLGPYSADNNYKRFTGSKKPQPFHAQAPETRGN